MALSSLVDAELVFRKTYPFRPRQYTSSPMAIEATTGSRLGLVRPLPEHPLHPLYRWRDHLTCVCRVFPEVPKMTHLARFSQLALLDVSAYFSGPLSSCVFHISQQKRRRFCCIASNCAIAIESFQTTTYTLVDGLRP
jgi:hypothetical protein